MLASPKFRVLAFTLVIIWSAACSKKDQANNHLSSADRYFQAEHYGEAEVEYRNVLQLAPLNPTAIGRLGIIYHDQGRLPQAYAYLQKAIELEPENLDVQLKLGSTCLSIGKFKGAREAAMRILEKQPGHEKALLLLADTAHAPEELQETEHIIEHLRRQDRDRAGYHLALGAIYFRQQDSTRAQSEIKKALDLDPNSSAVHFVLGNLYWSISTLHLALGNPNWTRYDLSQADQAFQTAIEFAPLRSDERLRYIDFKLQTGAVEEGKKALEEITRKAPDFLPAWVCLMKIAFDDRRYADCAGLAQNILKRDPDNYQGLLQSATLKLATGETARAVPEFEHLNSVYQRVPQVQYHLAFAYIRNGDSARATSMLNQAIILKPDFDEANLLLAELNIREGNFAIATDSLTQIVKQRPQTLQAHLLLARAYLGQKNSDQALAVYRRMMELFPGNPQVPLLLGMVLVQQNQRTDARPMFEKSLEISSDYAPALAQLVDLDLVEAQYSTAMDRVKNVIEKNPEGAQPRFLQAKIYFAQHDMTQAEEALLRAIGLDPKLQPAYLMLAQIYVSENKRPQAIERLTTLVAGTNNLAALMQIGIIQNELKNFEAARDAYERLLVLDPKFGPALNNLACLYSEHLGQLDKAYEIANRARGLLPADPSTADTLGWILFKRAEYDRALVLLGESAEKLGADPEIQHHLGMTHYMLGEEESARLALRLAAATSKDFPDKEEAQRRLAMLNIDIKMAGPSDLEQLEKRLREEPNDPVALDRLAGIQERDGTPKNAVRNYETELKINPRNAHVMLKLARLYFSSLHDPQKALGLAEGAHKLVPDDPAVTQTLGRLVYQAHDYGRASILLEDAERKLSDQPELMHDLAWSYYSVGRVAEAEAMMEHALQIGGSFPGLEDAKRFVAMIAAVQSSSAAQAALSQAQEILNADLDYIPAVMVSALSQEQQGKCEEAKQLYEKVLAAFPLLAPATRQLAVLYAQRLGDEQKAYEFAVKAREAFPEDTELAKTLGILEYQRGDYTESALHLQESAQKRTDDAELLYYLGMSDYRLKEWRQSKEALERALALKVSTNLAEEARRSLAQLK